MMCLSTNLRREKNVFSGQVTGKALILDEIINYVQSLQNQVEVNHKSRILIVVLKCCASDSSRP
jgi:hypothetical protein